MKEDQGMNSNDNTLTARDTNNGISKLPEIQLILSYKISCNSASLEIPLLSLEHNTAITSLWGMLQEITNNC